MSGEDPTIEVSLNQLRFFPYERKDFGGSEPNAQDYLTFLVGSRTQNPEQFILSSYEELTEEAQPLHVTPANEHFNLQITGPLKEALSSFVTGNYLSALATCHFAMERTCNIIFRIENEQSGAGRKFSANKQKRLFGDVFEKLNASRKSDVLLAIGWIDDTDYKSLEIVRLNRNSALHGSHDPAVLRENAKQSYIEATNVLSRFLGVNFEGGKLLLSERALRYLRSQKNKQDD